SHRLLSPQPAAPWLSPLSLHDALPISERCRPADERQRDLPDPGGERRGEHPERHDEHAQRRRAYARDDEGQEAERGDRREQRPRSEEHTSELQSPYDLVCRLLLEKKKK